MEIITKLIIYCILLLGVIIFMLLDKKPFFIFRTTKHKILAGILILGYTLFSILTGRIESFVKLFEFALKFAFLMAGVVFIIMIVVGMGHIHRRKIK